MLSLGHVLSVSLISAKSDETSSHELETLVWSPDGGLSDKEIDKFLVLARYPNMRKHLSFG